MASKNDNKDLPEVPTDQVHDEVEMTRIPDPELDMFAVEQDDDIYSAGDDHHEKSGRTSKEKKVGFVAPIEKAPPPPYTPAVVDVTKKSKPLWRRRWFLLALLGLLALVVILLAVLLSINKKHAASASNSTSNSSPSSPTSPTSPTSTPSHTPHFTGSTPLLNTAIAAVSITNSSARITDSGWPSVVQIIYQDDDLYLSSKISTSGVESWTPANNGNRIMLALNSTPISAVHQPQDAYNMVPIRVFFVSPNGYLADVYQSTWGGPWQNGTLSKLQFKVGNLDAGMTGYNSVSAGWCDGQGVYVYAMGTDARIHAFLLADTERYTGDGGTWTSVWQREGVKEGVNVAVNIAAVCLFPGRGPPPLFINTFDVKNETGSLITWFNDTSVTVPLPEKVASKYRPDSPIAAIYGQFPVSKQDSTGALSNSTMLLFFPLSVSLYGLTPNPSLHILSAEPYWSGSELIPGTSSSRIATTEALDWNKTQHVDTRLVPYAGGFFALMNTTNGSGQDLTVGNGIVKTMPRAWCPLLMGASSTDKGRVMVFFQDNGRGIQVAEIKEGGEKWPIIDVD